MRTKGLPSNRGVAETMFRSRYNYPNVASPGGGAHRRLSPHHPHAAGINHLRVVHLTRTIACSGFSLQLYSIVFSRSSKEELEMGL